MAVSEKRFETVRQPSEFGESRYAQVRESRFANSPKQIAVSMSRPKQNSRLQPSISEPWLRPARQPSRLAQATNPLPVHGPQRLSRQAQAMPQPFQRSSFAQRPQQFPVQQSSIPRAKPMMPLPPPSRRSSLAQRPQLPLPGQKRPPFAQKPLQLPVAERSKLYAKPQIPATTPSRPSSLGQRPQLPLPGQKRPLFAQKLQAPAPQRPSSLGPRVQVPAPQRPSSLGSKPSPIGGVVEWRRPQSSLAPPRPETPWTLAVRLSSFKGVPAEPQGAAQSRLKQEPPALPNGDTMLSALADLLARRNERQEEKNPGGPGIRPSRTYNPFGR